jgi:hypothetical protein
MVPARPVFGTNVRAAVTVNVVVAESPNAPKILITFTPPVAPAATVKEALTVPSIPIWHVQPGAIRPAELPVKVHGPASPRAKPDPVTITDVPRGPALGFAVISCSTMLRIALAETGVVSVTVIVSLSPAYVKRTVKNVPVNVKSAATVQAPGAATEAPVIVQAPAVPKLVPVIVTVSPTCAGFGVSVWSICGTTVKVKLTELPVLPVICMVLAPAGLFNVLTTKEPVTTPLDTAHV